VNFIAIEPLLGMSSVLENTSSRTSMQSKLKNNVALYGAASLLAVAGISAISLNSGDPAPAATAASPLRAKSSPAQAAANRAEDMALAAQGLLWERGTAGQKELRASIPVQAGPLRAVVGQAVGDRVKLDLSERFAALEGEITGSSTQDDGTVITHIRIDGEPQGTLTVQENKSLGFFLGQLYFDASPVAYEFRPSGNGLMASRHALSGLLCSMLNQNQDGVEAMGLPPLNKTKAQAAIKSEEEAAAKNKLIQQAKPGGTTALGLSVLDASISEGNSGTKSLSVTVKLSKSDRTKTISASYATQNGTASAGSDYTAVSGTVTFAPGTTTRTVSVPISGDTTLEPNETFLLLLSNPLNAVISDGSATCTISNDEATPSNVPLLNSLPGAEAVAYLDMDGQVVTGTQWLNGGTINAGAISTTYTQAQMTEIWRRSAEDYAPFQINVTTDEAAYLAAPSNRRIRCVITPDNEWYGAYGGVAYINSFTWTGDTPCWVFSDQLSNTARYIAEACSHEIGHTLGLLHDGRVSPSEGYYEGHGSGETGWAPIMGVGYYQLLVQWSRGEYLSANNKEDDLAMITTNNGFGYRGDQQPGTPAGAPALVVSGTSVSGSGIIETGSDADTFAFTTTGGAVSLTALGDATSQNLDVLAEILDAAGNVLAASNPDTLTDATVSASLAAGTYFVRVSGVGRGDPLASGYTDYGSLGQYSISGTVP
jgi:hypothetical protein